jgi:hypothetical protein
MIRDAGNHRHVEAHEARVQDRQRLQILCAVAVVLLVRRGGIGIEQIHQADSPALFPSGTAPGIPPIVREDEQISPGPLISWRSTIREAARG